MAVRACFSLLVHHRLNVTHDRPAAVIDVSGEVDAYVAPDLEAAFAGVAEEPRVVVDLLRVSFLDSTALGVIVRELRRISERGASGVVVLPRGPARRIFEITTLDKVLPVAGSRTDAVKRLAADVSGQSPVG